MKEKDLEGMFSPFGTVISTRILRDNNGVSRGVGFCRMESREKCQQIIEAFNGHMVQGMFDTDLRKNIRVNSKTCACTEKYFFSMEA